MTTADPRSLPLNMDTYLERVHEQCGFLVLTGLLADKAANAVPIADVYVSLLASRPDGRGRALDGKEIRALSERLGRPRKEGEDGAPDAGDRRALAAALRAAGAPEEEVGLDGVLADVWQRLRDLGDRRDEQRIAAVLGTVQVDGALRQHRHLLIEGDPGSGKTTTLMHLATVLVQAHRGKPDEARRMGFEEPFPLPVFVPLRRLWATLRTLPTEELGRGAELLVRHMEKAVDPLGGGQPWIRKALEAGAAVLLLDGLDEVGDLGMRARAAEIVRELAKQYAGCRYVVTSRPSGLSAEERLRLREMAHSVVEPLTDRQIGSFVNAWYGALEPDRATAETRAGALLRRIMRADKVRALAQTPVMLTGIAVVHQTNLELPERRAELYEHCVKALAHRLEHAKKRGDGHDAAHEREKGSTHGTDDTALATLAALSVDEKITLLQEMAYELHCQGAEDALLERGPAAEIVCRHLGCDHKKLEKSSERCIELVEALGERSGLLIPASDGAYKLRHKTFQEYLAARRICDLSEDGDAELAERLDDPWWREPVLLAPAYVAKDSKAKAQKLLVRLALEAVRRERKEQRVRAVAAVALAILDLREAKVPRLDAVAEVIREASVELLSDRSQPGEVADRLAMGRVLGFYRDPRLSDEARWVEVPAGPFWRGAAEGDGGAVDAEEPGRAVTLSKFRIARWPVTVGEVAEFIEDRGYERPELWLAAGWRWRSQHNVLAPYQWGDQAAGPLNVPAVGVSFWEADALCRWRTARDPAIPAGWTIRLPTETEWEKAARGPLAPSAKDERIYPWGRTWDPLFAASGETPGVDGPAPVGCFPAGHGPYEAWDQAGNVWEWCLDAWNERAYAHEPPDDPVAIDDDGRPVRVATVVGLELPEARARVFRGGGFGNGSQFLRVSCRGWGGPEGLWRGQGFRCVAAPPAPGP